MKILSISGASHKIVSQYGSKKTEYMNNTGLILEEAIPFIQDNSISFHGVLITDEALPVEEYRVKSILSEFLNYIDKQYPFKSMVIFVTKDVYLAKHIWELCDEHKNFRILVHDAVRVPSLVYEQAHQMLDENGSSDKVVYHNAKEKDAVQVQHEEKSEKKGSLFQRFRSMLKEKDDQIEAKDDLTKEIEKISMGISRVVAVTGHRGCGLSSTAANIACEANHRGLSTIIIDLDIDYRSMNMYFSSFHEYAVKNEDMSASLIRTLARPQDYKTTAFPLKEKLWLTGLSYKFKDKKLLDQFYTSNKLIGLISVLRQKFNLVLIDMPMDLLGHFREAMIHIDVFGLCVPNNLYAVLNTLQNIDIVLSREDASYLNAKTKIIVTKYNDRSCIQEEFFTPEKVCDVLTSDISEFFNMEVQLGGSIPFSHEFDKQIENDTPIVLNSVEYQKAFGNILLRLMKGV